MYGVPADLDLTFLHGAELVQVGLGVHQVQFRFSPDTVLSVEGEWELVEADGTVIDRNSHPRVRPYQMHRLLGLRVAGSEIGVPDWIALQFETGEKLRVFDSSREFESFSIMPAGIVV